MRRLFFISLLVLSASLQAQVFKRVDPITGQVTYTNQPPPGNATEDVSLAEQTAILPKERMTKPEEERGRSKPRALTSIPTSFPRIDAAEQKRRDLDRQAILSEELHAEEQALKKLQGRQGSEEVARRHVANIESLRRELSKL